MKIVIKKNNETILHAVFVLWWLGEIMFAHTTISQLTLMAFVGVTILVTHRWNWTAQLTGYTLLAVWSALNILSGHAYNNSVAWSMTRTIVLNILFLYAFTSYCWYIKDPFKVLKVYKSVAFVFAIITFVGGVGGALRGQRLSILGINANQIAMIMAYTIIILFYEFINSTDRKQRRTDLLMILFLVLTVLLTGSRKGLLIPFIGIYVLISIRNPRKIVKYTVITAVVVAIVLVIIMNVDVLYNIIGNRVEVMLDFMFSDDSATAGSSLESRDKLIALGMQWVERSPFWGNGLGCFYLIPGSYGTYSHSNFVEVLFSLGWVGLIIHYSPFAVAITRIICRWKHNPTRYSFMLAVLTPFLICDYMNITYFERLLILLPALVMVCTGKKEIDYDQGTA